MDKQRETRTRAGQNASGGPGSVRNRCLAITKGFRVRKRTPERSKRSKFGRSRSKPESANAAVGNAIGGSKTVQNKWLVITKRFRDDIGGGRAKTEA